jgi:membrane protein required for beta-lactamase induction
MSGAEEVRAALTWGVDRLVALVNARITDAGRAALMEWQGS